MVPSLVRRLARPVAGHPDRLAHGPGRAHPGCPPGRVAPPGESAGLDEPQVELDPHHVAQLTSSGPKCRPESLRLIWPVATQRTRPVGRLVAVSDMELGPFIRSRREAGTPAGDATGAALDRLTGRHPGVNRAVGD
jgi:hypothetical protein